MRPATSAIVKHEHNSDRCMYCGGKLTEQWESKVENGLERCIKKCENGHTIRKKTSPKRLSIMQYAKLHSLDK